VDALRSDEVLADPQEVKAVGGGDERGGGRLYGGVLGGGGGSGCGSAAGNGADALGPGLPLLGRSGRDAAERRRDVVLVGAADLRAATVALWEGRQLGKDEAERD